ARGGTECVERGPGAGGAGDAAGRRCVSEQRALELADAVRERGAAARGVHGPRRERDPRRRCAQAGAGRSRRLRGLLPVRGQRRHGQARGAGSGAGPRSRDPVPRRAVHRPRSHQRPAPGRPDPRPPRRPRHHGRGRDPRSGQHPSDRRQLGLSRHGDEDDDGARKSQGLAGRSTESASAGVPEPGVRLPMSNRVKVHPVAIGAFATGAVMLAVAALFIFGANKVFSGKFPVVMFFDENVNGLTIGAPVSYRGLRLGEVTQIRSPVGTSRIEVLATLERGPLVTRRNVAEVSADQMRQTLEDAITQGLRAQLAIQIFRTGLVYVSLVLRPDPPAATAGLGGSALEIPTIPTIMSQIQAGLEKVPLAQVPKYLSDTLEGSARLLQG